MKKILLSFAIATFAAGAHAITTGPTPHGPVAYPPSCLAWPMFTDQPLPSTPTYSQSSMLAVLDRATKQPAGFELVDFTFWRVPCDGGKSALLLRISRAPTADRSRVVQFPPVQGIGARQGSFSSLARLAQEPNTQDSSLVPGALIPSAVTLVLENFYRNDGSGGGALKPDVSQAYLDPSFDFNQAIDFTIPAAPGIGVSPIPPPRSIPAYDARPYAGLPLPISGYVAGSYFDPAHSGEGIIVDVMGGFVGDFMLSLRAITLAWFTYDQAGRPFWLYGTAMFLPTVKTVDVPMFYFANGSFAGGSSAPATRSPWGTVTVGFPDCGSMYLRYAANANLPAPVPSGSGERVWARLTEENGLSCR